MLDMGFMDDIAKVVRQCPAQRQTLLFSATYPEGIASLAADATGLLPDDYELLLEFDDKVYARRKSH